MADPAGELAPNLEHPGRNAVLDGHGADDLEPVTCTHRGGKGDSAARIIGRTSESERTTAGEGPQHQNNAEALRDREEQEEGPNLPDGWPPDEEGVE